MSNSDEKNTQNGSFRQQSRRLKTNKEENPKLKEHGWSKTKPNNNAWSRPRQPKPIKHEVFQGDLNPDQKWPEGTVVKPMFEGWNVMDQYEIKKKKRDLICGDSKFHGRRREIFWN